MKTRSVRMDQETEELLQSILQRSNLSISQAFKQGIKTLARSMQEESFVPPYEIFRTLDLGPGGESRLESGRVKQGLPEVIAMKHWHDNC